MKKRGLTLVEMLVVIGIMVTVVGIATPMALNQVFRATTEAEARKLASSIYVLQQRAYTGNGNSAYGIKFTNADYTTFNGTAFSSGTNKESTSFDAKVKASQIQLTGGVSELSFNKGSYLPSASGTIALTSASDTYIVELNAQGFVTYYKQ